MRRKNQTRTVGQIVVYRVVFRRQIGEEEHGEVLDALFLVLKTLGHLPKLSLDLDHAVQDKMREHHQRVLLHHQVRVRQPAVQLVAVLVDDRAERHRDVAERDRDVAPDVRIPRRLEDAEEQVVVCVAELRAHAEELAKRERRHRPQCRVLRKKEKHGFRRKELHRDNKHEP